MLNPERSSVIKPILSKEEIRMQMTLRWFGDTKDTVSLEQIRQVPGVVGVVPALHTLPCGEPWPLDMIMEMKKKF